MSKITTACTSGPEISGWIKSRQNEVQQHLGWQGKMEAVEAESLLQHQEALTYLLRNGEEKHVYYISFVKPDLSIKHQRFTLEHDRKGWYYKNGAGDGPTEIVADTIEKLIPQMMHCPSRECNILRLGR